MKHYLNIKLILVTTGCLLLSFQVYAVTGKILNETEAAQADTLSLSSEASVFKSIGNSIALSIAQCKQQTDCVPTVNQQEIDTLLETLDNRINNIVKRQEESGEDLTEILTAYVDQRESYLQYKTRLDTLLTPVTTVEEVVPEAVPADVTVEEAPIQEEPADVAETEVEAEEEVFDIFQDAEEAIE